MTTTQTMYPKAEVGRRVMFAHINDPREHGGVITGTKTTANGALLVRVRLNGARSNIHIPADHENLRYLDEIGPVPELPMGRFTPDSKSIGFDFEYDGVLVAEFEDGDMVAVTADREKAVAAVSTYLREVADVTEESDVQRYTKHLYPRWVAFEWEPEDAECTWLMNPASEGDDQALQVHYLPY